MPYDGEFAQFRSIKRLAESERVKNLLGSYEVRHTRGIAGRRALRDVLARGVSPSDWQPARILAVDGSHIETPIENGFPGAEASYVTVAAVLVDWAKTRELDAQRPVNPKSLRETESAHSIDCALPGCNIVSNGANSAAQSLRQKVYDVFGGSFMLEGGESLLDTYHALLAHKPRSHADASCPYIATGECPNETAHIMLRADVHPCSCVNRLPWYSTDALRFHEEMAEAGTNGAMFGEIMQVLERVWVVHLLRVMEAKGWLGLLRDMAIVVDGPLAVFGHPAWLSQAIYREISRINRVARPFLDGRDILLVGIEKSGQFVAHMDMLDRDAGGHPGEFPGQVAALLDDAYIKENILFSRGGKPYGEASYFGRKFLYKTKSGAKIVAMTPFLEESHRNLATATPEQYPRLPDVLSLLDQVVSSRYPNALTPLVSAHAEAAIPLNLGKKVLEQLARELIAEARP